jgi:hypothetical protein
VRALAAVLVALPAIAQADSSVTVTLTPFGEQLAMGLGDSVDGLIQKVHDTIDDIYQTARIGPLLDAFMTTSASITRSGRTRSSSAACSPARARATRRS